MSVVQVAREAHYGLARTLVVVVVGDHQQVVQAETAAVELVKVVVVLLRQTAAQIKVAVAVVAGLLAAEMVEVAWSLLNTQTLLQSQSARV
jgi:hypothetical protein